VSKKAQVVLSDYQYGIAEQEAHEKGTSVSALLRAGLESFLKELERRRKREALEHLFSMNNPVDDWPKMKEQMLKSYDHAGKDWQPGS
jgi:hypothetical protein